MSTTIEELQTAAEAAQHALAEALADGNALPISKARKAAQEAQQAVSDAVAVQEVLRQSRHMPDRNRQLTAAPSVSHTPRKPIGFPILAQVSS